MKVIAILAVFFLLTIPASAEAIRLGKAYVQDSWASNCQWNGQERACNWSLNPKPVFAEYAPVSPAMKDGALVERLHSWAGYTVWPNSSMLVVKPDVAVNKTTQVIEHRWNRSWMPFLQQPLFAEPLILNFRSLSYSNYTNYGDVSGLIFSMPIPVASPGPVFNYNNCTGSSWSVDSKKNMVDQGGFWASGLRVIPVNSTTATEPSWGPDEFPDNIITDRMGDWDIDFLFKKKTSSEYLKLTMAKGSPFSWFTWHQAPADGLMAFTFYTGPPFNPNSQRMHVNYTTVDTGIANLGCYIVGTNQDHELNSDDSYTQLTNWNYFAVFYDTRTLTATENPDHGITLRNVSTTGDPGFVIAGLPVVSYPVNDGMKPTAIQAQNEAKAWAAAIAPYAFNYVTDTRVKYRVDAKAGLLHTNYTATTVNRGPVGAGVGNKTVMALQRHQYGTFNDGRGQSVFDGDLGALTVSPAGAGTWLTSMPAVNNGHYQYWIAKGKLLPVAVTGFDTTYVVNNLMPFMPPMDANATMDGEFLWHIVNADQAEYTHKNIGSDPPFYTYLDGGDHNANYNLAKKVRYIAGKLAVLQGLAGVAAAAPEITGGTSWDVERWTIDGHKWNGTEYYIRYRDKPYDPNLALGRDVSAIEEFFRLYTMQIPFRSVNNTVSSRWQYSPYYFMYDDRLGALHMYPAQGPDVRAQMGGVPPNPPTDLPAYGYFPMPAWDEGPGFGAEDGFGTTAEWNDIQYLHGHLLTAAAMVAWFDPDWAKQENYGQFIDQLVMVVAYDPDVSSFYKHPSLKYSKMNFFDQWAGQAWTQGQITGVWHADGKDDNSLGETMQVWAGIAMWGSVTNRPEIADLGTYLYTTNLYNADAYWFDKTLAYVPNSTGISSPSSARWSTWGDYIPVTAQDGGVKYNAGESMWDRYFNWGNPKTSMPAVEGYPVATSMVPKMTQGKLTTGGQFGISPSSNMYNMWLPIGSYSLGFGRDQKYMELFTRTLDYAPNNGYCLQADPGGKRYLTTVNQQRVLAGATNAAVPAGTTSGIHVSGAGITPYQWFWNLNQHYKDTAPGSYPYNIGVWWDNVNGYVDDSQSIAESLDYFWAMDTFGTPNFTVFSYSADAYGSGLTQPQTAAFTTTYGRTTYVAWNPHADAVQVNWWRLGSDATLTPGLLSPDLTVPAHGYAKVTVPEKPPSLSVHVYPESPVVDHNATQNFTITVKNIGDVPVYGITTRDYLRDKMLYRSSSPAGTAGLDTVRWTTGTLSPGEERNYSVSSLVGGTANGTFANVAMANGTFPWGEPVSASGYGTYYVNGGPSLGIEYVANRTSVSSGDYVAFNITLTNTGTEEFAALSITDALTSKMSFANIIVDEARWGNGTIKTDVMDNVLTVKNFSAFAPGESTLVTIVLKADSAGTFDKNLSASGALPGGSICTASASIPSFTITGSGAQLRVDTVTDRSSVRPGTNVTYIVNVTNTGDTTFVILNLWEELDTLAQNLDMDTLHTDPAFKDYIAPSHTVDWLQSPPNYKGLKPGQTQTFALQAQVKNTATGTLVNKIRIQAFPAGGASALTPSTWKNVTVTSGGIYADFTSDTTTGTTPVTVHFTDRSDGAGSDIATWNWTFGDGATSTLENPVHVYASGGKYMVSLSVQNETGGSARRSIPAYINISDAQFTASVTEGYAPMRVQFNDTSSGNGVTSWQWDVDNDSVTDYTTQNPVHWYTDPGIYTVVLNATGPGFTDTEVKTGLIHVVPRAGAPNLYREVVPGGTVYIGESGLDIWQPMYCSTTLAWFPAGAPLTSMVPEKVVNVSGQERDFTVSPSDFAGRTGQWYSWFDGNTLGGSPPAFVVAEPSIDLRIIDNSTGTDVTDSTIAPGDELGLVVTGNLDALPERGVTDVPVRILITGPGGATYTSLTNRSGAATLLPDLMSPPGFTTGPVWDTVSSLYPPGGYTLTARYDFNDMATTYPVPGRAARTRVLNLSYTPAVILPPPTYAAATPLTGYRNSTVVFTITGSNFETGPGNTTVELRNQSTGLITALLTNVTTTRIDGNVSLPANATTGLWNIRIVTTHGGEITRLNAFTISAIPKPTVTAIAPAGIWYRNSTVNYTIMGTNFQPGNTNVTLWNASGTWLNATSGSGVWLVTPTTIYGTVIVPYDAPSKTPYNVTVRTSDGGTGGKAAAFTVGDALKPTVTAITPAGVWYRNSTVNYTITGTNFQSGNTNVTLWNASGTWLNATAGSGVWLVTPTTIYGTVIVPYEAPSKTAFNVTVRTYNGGVGGKAAAFTVGDALKPTVTSISPAGVWYRNSTVNYTITGTNFQPENTNVTIWNATGSWLNATSGSGVWLVTPTTIYGTVTVPFEVSSKTAFNVTVKTYDGGTGGKAAAFTVGGALKPTVTAITPAGIWYRNSTVNYTITGTNFQPGNTNVTLWNASGTLLNATSGSGVWLVTPTTIYGTVIVPYEAPSKTAFNVTVRTYQGGTGGKAAAFTVGDALKPTVTAITPAGVWYRNSTVNYTITGTNFQPGNTNVTLWNASGTWLNATSGSGVWLVTPTTIYGTVIVPYESPSKTAFNVTVRTYNGGSGGKAAAFTVGDALKPTVTAITPAGIWYRNSTVNYTITGTNFQSGNTNVTLWNASGTLLNATSGSGVWLVTPTTIYGTVIVPYEAPSKTAFNVTVRTYQGGTGGKPAAFTVGDALKPTVTAITPAGVWYRNSTVNYTITGTNFQPENTNVTLWNATGTWLNATSGSGVWLVTPTTIYGTVTVPYEVSSKTAFNVTVKTYDGGTGGKAAAFTVGDALKPTVIAITPAGIWYRNSTVNYTITGTNFQPGNTNVTLWNASGTWLNATAGSGVWLVTPTTIYGTVIVPYEAPSKTAFNVTVRTYNGGTGGKAAAFTVGNALKPTVTAITPAGVWYRNSTVNYTITGTNFQPENTNVTLWNTTGTWLNATSGSGVWLVTPTTIYGTVTVPYEISSKTAFNVTVKTYDGGIGGKAAAFTVGSFPAPVISSVMPVTGFQNSTVAFTVNGANFQPGLTTVTLDNAAFGTLDTSLYTVTSSRITGGVRIPTGATPGAWKFNVTTLDGGTRTAATPFTVAKNPVPVVTAFSPSPLYRGTTVSFTVTGNYFQTGGLTTMNLTNASGSTITTTLTKVFPTSITGTTTLPENMVPGLWKVNVTTVDGGTGTKVNAVTIF